MTLTCLASAAPSPPARAVIPMPATAVANINAITTIFECVVR